MKCKILYNYFGDDIRMKKKILLIIPAYNEQDCILNTYQKIMKYNEINHTNFEVIVVNDGSTDDTEKILKKNKIPHVKLIHNLGIGGAVQTGYKYAYENDYDIAVQFDGDGQHDINYVDNIVKMIDNNEANMVIGSRFVNKNLSDFKSTKSRQIGIRIISFFIKLVTGERIYDTTSGFRAVNSNLIKAFAENYPVEYPEPVSTVNVLKSGFTVREIAVSMNKRENGKSSIHTWKNIYYMINVILSILFVRTRYKK